MFLWIERLINGITNGFGNAAVLLRDHGAFKNLDALSGTFFDLHVDADGGADFKLEGFFTELVFGEVVENNVVHRLRTS